MSCSISDLKAKQVVCVKNGAVLGFISDVSINIETGNLDAIIIYGKSRYFGLFGREEDVYIPWTDINVIGNETVLINTDPSSFIIHKKRTKFPFNK